MENNIDWEVLSEMEKLKYESNYLRGTLKESLADEITGALAFDDRQLSKFHGIYQQFDRDTEVERLKSKLEPDYSFLIRVRVPGGLATSAQWIAMDNISDQYANHTLKLTTRQAFQFHGVIKTDLKKSIQAINKSLLDTIAACGDVNRNVMVSAHPGDSAVYQQVLEAANQVSAHLTPQTPAYFEIWLDDKKVAEGKAGEEVEPLYGRRYLPRKFKIGFAIPPYNDIDIYSQDLGFIAIEEEGKLKGFNVIVGGGMGTTFGVPTTFPRIGDMIGFISPTQAIEVAEKVVLIQRDKGNRKERKNARFKYTIETLGLENFKALLNELLSTPLSEAKPISWKRNGDLFGWKKDTTGLWHLTLYVEGGRVRDSQGFELKKALRTIAEQCQIELRLTGNQNIIISNVSEEDKKRINKIVKQYQIVPENLSGLRRNSIACVALNTCSLAFSEAERYLPTLAEKIEKELKINGLLNDEIVFRITGCPNGCGRPYLAEIGLIGKSLGHYNLYLGGNFIGTRLNNLYRENITEEEILEDLKLLFADYAKNRNEKEYFGDFVIRQGYVKEIKKGSEFKH